MTHERQGQAAEVGAAAKAGNHYVRIFAGQGHLFLCLKADNRLVQAHVIEHGTKGVFTVRGGDCQFDGLGDGTAKGAAVIGVGREDVLSGTGTHRRGRRYGGAKSLHNGAAERLLLIAYLYHIHGAVYAELHGGIAERTAPLASSGFSGEVGDALFLGIVCLGDGRVEFVASGRAHALVLEVDVCRGAQGCFQLICSYQRGTAVCGILLTYGFRDGDPLVCLVQFLVGAGLAEDGIEVLGLQRLLCCRVKERQRLVGHDCLDVEIVRRNLRFRKHVLFLSHNYYYYKVLFSFFGLPD